MTEIQRPASPQNYNERTSKISMVTLHDTEGNAQGTLSWFANPFSKVSAHVVIDKQGVIYRCVPDEKRAWHVRGYNDISLGVELEMLATDPDGAFTDAQMESCAGWVADKCLWYSIPMNRILPHAFLDPMRRTDPRGFGWYQFLLRVAELMLNA